MPDDKTPILHALGAVLAGDALAVDAEVDLRRRQLIRRHLAAHAVALLQMSLDADRLSVDVRLDEQGRPVVVCYVD
jgi:hypothetical protein